MAKLQVLERYGVCPNNILNDANLSLKAKGLWTYIQSKPENWRFSVRAMATQHKDGYDSVAAAIKELEAVGLLTTEMTNTAKGASTIYILSAKQKSPAGNSPAGKSPAGKSPAGKIHAVSNKELSKKELSKKENSITATAERVEDSLEEREYIQPIKAEKQPNQYYQVVEFVATIQGIKPFPDKGRQFRAAKMILDQGYTLDEVKTAAEAMHNDTFWKTKTFDVATLTRHVAKYYQQQATATIINLDAPEAQL